MNNQRFHSKETKMLGAPSIRVLCEWVGIHEPQPASWETSNQSRRIKAE
jgi:hypothetical protein